MKKEFNTALLKWYNENKRDLPWRKSREPYAIWISEVMAQQTRITAVMPYYERFMRLFPTVEALAASQTDQVLKAWEGLGYYSRAHNLQKAARIIVEEWGGRFPDDEKKLLGLPGIGAYTAGAILSISFDRACPAVDGNVLRVFARMYSLTLDVALPPAKAEVAQLVRQLMPQEEPGVFTQALMELGALICVPKNPSCTFCPVCSLCLAFHQGRQHELPVKSPKRPQKHLDKTVLLLVNKQNLVLVGQRQEKLLQGLWEFYTLDGKMDASEIESRLNELGFCLEHMDSLGASAHTFTHIIWDMEGYLCRIGGGDPPQGWRFVDKAGLEALAIPTALRLYKEKFARYNFSSNNGGKILRLHSE